MDLSYPKVMGIINVTPDSFYTGSRYQTDNQITAAAIKMTVDGADMLDVGGYSSRPGAGETSQEEEMRRVLPAIKLIKKELPDAIVSVDTFRSEIARAAVLDCGASMINDISGGEGDDKMFAVVEKLSVPYIIMHMKGTPSTMQNNPVYEDVVADLLRWFGKKIFTLHTMGVKDIIIDPGFGFGKTPDNNFDILSRLGDFRITGLPLLAGVSRKSMIWKTLEISPGEALNGTTVLNTIALLKGADILRVHGVREAVEAVRLVERLLNHDF